MEPSTRQTPSHTTWPAALKRLLHHWSLVDPGSLFWAALIQRAGFFFCAALMQGITVMSPLQRILGHWMSHSTLRHVDTAWLLLTGLLEGFVEKQARFQALRVPSLWWGGYVGRENLAFSVLWYYLAAAVPYGLGVVVWRYGHDYIRLNTHGFLSGLLNWGMEIILFATIRFGWFFIENALQPSLSLVSGDIEDRHPSQQLRSVSTVYQTFLRRGELSRSLTEGQVRPEDLPTFSYTGLKPGHIRLVRLVRDAAYPFSLQISLVTKHLARDNPRYIAISYVWGSPIRTHGLVVEDGSWLPTTASTYEILHEQAPWWSCNDPGQLFWIDFVCINQDDNREKERQVRMMQEIYSHSTQVVAYLRPKDLGDSDVAVFFLRSLLSDCTSMKRGRYGVFGIGNEHRLYHAIAGPVLGIISAITGLPPSPGWEALSHLIGHAHWTRVWILQELILAPNPGLRIMYGEHEIHWGELARFAELGPDDLQYVNTDWATMVSGGDLENNRRRVAQTLMHHARRSSGVEWDGTLVSSNLKQQRDWSLELPNLLSVTRAMESTDSRDRIWGVQGLLSDPATLPTDLLPKYGTTSAYDLYLSVARHCVSSADPEWLLCSAGIGHHNARSSVPDAECPSWVPEWTEKQPLLLAPAREKIGWKLSHPNIDRSLCQVGGRRLQILSASSRATIRAVLALDPIFHASRAGVVNAMNQNNDRAIRDVFCGIRDILAFMRTRELGNYPTGESPVDALGITLVAGLSDSVVEGFRFEYDMWETLLPLLDEMDEQGNGLSVSSFYRAMVYVQRSPGPGNGSLAEFTRLSEMCDLRSLAATEDGYFVLAPKWTKEGDRIYQFSGMKSWFILRPLGNSPSTEFKLVGDCYVHGMERAESGKSSTIFLA